MLRLAEVETLLDSPGIDRRRVSACRAPGRARRSRSRSGRSCSRSRARSARRGRHDVVRDELIARAFRLEARRRVASRAIARRDGAAPVGAQTDSRRSARHRAASRSRRAKRATCWCSRVPSKRSMPPCSRSSSTARRGRAPRSRSRWYEPAQRAALARRAGGGRTKCSPSGAGARAAGSRRPCPDSRRLCYSPVRCRLTRMSPMKTSKAQIIREYGPFPGIKDVAGVTFDGEKAWFAVGRQVERARSRNRRNRPHDRRRRARGHGVRWQASLSDRREGIQKIDPKTGK